MPSPKGKKIVTVTVKVSAENREQFEKVCNAEDRSMSYVVRELALRGLAQYKSDGILKFSDEDELVDIPKQSKTVKSLSALDVLEANPEFEKKKKLSKATERMYKNAGEATPIEELNKKK